MAFLGLWHHDVRHEESELSQMRAQFYKANRDWERTKKLESQRSISQTEVDATQSAWETAKAAVPEPTSSRCASASKKSRAQRIH